MHHDARRRDRATSCTTSATASASARSTAAAARPASPRRRSARSRWSASTRSSAPATQYVTAAKVRLIGEVGIDMTAGPTELVVIADEIAERRARAGRPRRAGGAWRRLGGDLHFDVGRALRRCARRCNLVRRRLDRRGDRASPTASRRSIFRFMHAEPRRSRSRLENCGAIFCGPSSPVGRGRLHRRTESRAADRRQRALLLAARRLRLREALERHHADAPRSWRRSAEAGERIAHSKDCRSTPHRWPSGGAHVARRRSGHDRLHAGAARGGDQAQSERGPDRLSARAEGAGARARRRSGRGTSIPISSRCTCAARWRRRTATRPENVLVGNGSNELLAAAIADVRRSRHAGRLSEADVRAVREARRRRRRDRAADRGRSDDRLAAARRDAARDRALRQRRRHRLLAEQSDRRRAARRRHRRAARHRRDGALRSRVRRFRRGHDAAAARPAGHVLDVLESVGTGRAARRLAGIDRLDLPRDPQSEAPLLAQHHQRGGRRDGARDIREIRDAQRRQHDRRARARLRGDAENRRRDPVPVALEFHRLHHARATRRTSSTTLTRAASSSATSAPPFRTRCASRSARRDRTTRSWRHSRSSCAYRHDHPHHERNERRRHRRTSTATARTRASRRRSAFSRTCST